MALNRRVIVGFLGACLVGASLTACANAPDAATISGSAAPGVTKTEVDVGALVTQSGPFAADFGAIVPGVKAYFSWVNSRGGVWGRKVVLAHNADDGGIPSNNATQARTLVQQDHVFAIVGAATAFFTASKYLAQTGTPTFGYAVQDDWSGPNNLFAAYGSAIDFSTVGPFFAFAAQRAKATSVGLMAYNVPQSSRSCQEANTALQRVGVKVGYADLSVPFGGDMSSDILRMKEAHVDYVIDCLDVNGNIQVARTLHQNGMTNVAQFWLDGYDTSTLSLYGPLMTNTYFLVQHVPFEAAAQFPGAFPGLERYLEEMKRYAPSQATSEVAMDGWLNAALFVEGLRIAGPHPTQAAVVKAINQITSFTGDGLTVPINWQVAHTKVTPPSCTAFSKTVTGPTGSQIFKVAYNKGKQVWVCFPVKGPINTTKPVPPPAGSP